MKKSSVKKLSALLLSCFMLMNTTACNKAETNKISSNTASTKVTKPTETTSAKPEEQISSSPKANTSINKIEAGLGDLKLYYNKLWTYDAKQSQDASLAFTRGNTLIGVVCAQETTYQLPQDMMKRSLHVVKEQYKDLEMISEMKEVKVNGESWYECSYKTGSGEEAEYSLQRTYAKNYYAYTITYTGLKSDFEAYKSNALTILNSCIMSVPDNAGEKAAKKELIGELDAGKYGYLELKADGTYYAGSKSGTVYIYQIVISK